MAIADEIAGMHLGIDIAFCSYATGAETFRKRGRDVIDLGLPEANEFFSTLLACRRIIAERRPSVVVAHEEFAALGAAKLEEVPGIFVSAWLPQSNTVGAEVLAYAAEIIVIGPPGIFPVPRGVRARPFYTGPILRKMSYTLADRARVRSEMALPDDGLYVIVLPGGSAKEETSPIADSVLAGFSLVDRAHKRLTWVSDHDFERITERARGVRGVEAIRFVDPIERLMVAADLVITKGTRGATLDAAALGVPTISLSPGTNPIDDSLVPRIPGNIALFANAVDSEIVAHYISAATLCIPSMPAAAEDATTALRLAAERIASGVLSSKSHL